MAGWIILGVFLLFLAVVLIRAALFVPKPQKDAPQEDVTFDREKAVKALQQLIRCKTVSYNDPALEDDGEFEKLTALFNFSYEEKYYELDVPKGEYKVILDSDWECFSGNTKKEKKTYRVSDGKLRIKLAPYSAKYLISNY